MAEMKKKVEVCKFNGDNNLNKTWAAINSISDFSNSETIKQDINPIVNISTRVSSSTGVGQPQIVQPPISVSEASGLKYLI